MGFWFIVRGNPRVSGQLFLYERCPSSLSQGRGLKAYPHPEGPQALHAGQIIDFQGFKVVIEVAPALKKIDMMGHLLILVRS